MISKLHQINCTIINHPVLYGRKDVIILWDVSDREIKSNRPDLIIKRKGDKVCEFSDFAFPSDKKLSKKEREKFEKYQDLKVECE